MLRTIFKTFIVALAAMALVAPGAVSAKKNTTNTVSYTGQGLIADGFGGFDLITEICGVANGADLDGPYLLWVLTATGATSATITGPWGTANMTASSNGTFKYISSWSDPNDLVPNVVSATYQGIVTNAQLVISHGCRPFNPLTGAWCSPGFFGHVDAAGWLLIGVDPATATFGATVAADPEFIGTDLTAVSALGSTLLSTILNTASGTYKGSAIGTYKGWAANAFNLTGAWLTNQIPGYTFDPSIVQDNDSNTCPIDNHGDYKVPQQ